MISRVVKIRYIIFLFKQKINIYTQTCLDLCLYAYPDHDPWNDHDHDASCPCLYRDRDHDLCPYPYRDRDLWNGPCASTKPLITIKTSFLLINKY